VHALAAPAATAPECKSAGGFKYRESPLWVVLPNYDTHIFLMFFKGQMVLESNPSSSIIKYSRRDSYNLLMTKVKVAPNVSNVFQYVSYQTFNSITPGSIHRLQKKTNV